MERFHPVKNAASNVINASSVWFWETVVARCFYGGAADEVVSERFKRLSETDKFMNVDVKRVVLMSLLIGLMIEIIE